jgi:hypothetical protein
MAAARFRDGKESRISAVSERARIRIGELERTSKGIA